MRNIFNGLCTSQKDKNGPKRNIKRLPQLAIASIIDTEPHQLTFADTECFTGHYLTSVFEEKSILLALRGKENIPT